MIENTVKSELYRIVDVEEQDGILYKMTGIPYDCNKYAFVDGNSALGSSTEAGLRQHLQSDAIPLVIDEAENANAFTDENRIQGILELARLSSSETDGAKTFKGSSSGASNEYQIRSAFLLSSITSSLKQGSDKTRFALLQLQGHETTDITDHWKELKPRLAKVNTEMGRRLLARTVQLLPTIRKNVETWKRS